MSSANPVCPGTGRMIRTPTHNALVVYHSFFPDAIVFSRFWEENSFSAHRMAGEGAEAMEERLNMGGGGVLTLRQDGPRVHIEAERPQDGKGLYKVWLHGDQGGKLLLGTLVPEDGALRLRRTLSVSALERAGCWPRFRAEADLAFAFGSPSGGRWYCEQHPDRLVADPVLRARLQGAMLCRKGPEGSFALSAPFRTDRPVRLPALFCFSQVERRDGQLYMVWNFDPEGNPKFPHKSE